MREDKGWGEVTTGQAEQTEWASGSHHCLTSAGLAGHTVKGLWSATIFHPQLGQLIASINC